MSDNHRCLQISKYSAPWPRFDILSVSQHAIPRRCYIQCMKGAEMRWVQKIIEPAHDKTNKMACAPRPVWSESSLLAQWVAKGPRFLRADSEDSDEIRQAQAVWFFAGCTSHCVCFVVLRFIYKSMPPYRPVSWHMQRHWKRIFLFYF